MEKYGPTIVTILEVAFLLAAPIFCGSWTYSLAKGKGRNKWGWFLVGFFFTLIGVIVALLIPPAPSEMTLTASRRRRAEQETPTMTSVASPVRDIAWGRALLAGAVAGGVVWGAFVTDVLGTPVGEHYGTIIEPRMTIAAIVSVVCGIIAVALVVLSRSAAPARSRVLLSAATALTVAVVSGWIVLGFQIVQLIIFDEW